ncbi:hypothetical protein JW905_14670 [bacterium]|nr:hypothetical protein [candidate division CSSED10-310 bacterium]
MRLAVIFLLGLLTTGLSGCDILNQDPVDLKNEVYIYNETSADCPLLLYMDLAFQFAVPHNCTDCVIENVAKGVHFLEVYLDEDGSPGRLVAAVTIEVSDYEDWWWRIRSCSE